MTSDRQSTVKEMLDAAKNIKKSDDATLKYKNEMIEEMMNKGADRKMAEEMAERISKIAESAAGKPDTPKLTNEGLLQLENILKNMETGGKKARDLNSDGGRIGLFLGGNLEGGYSESRKDSGGKQTTVSFGGGGGGGNNNPPPVVNPVSNNEPAVNPIFRKTLREPELQLDAFIKKMELENAIKEEEEDVTYPTSGSFLDPNLDEKKQADIFSEYKADGGRIGLKGGMNKRTFLKLMGSVGATIGAAKSGIFSGFGKGAGKTVAKEVAQQTTSSMPPPYFFKLAEKIKMMGDDVTATTDRTIAKSLKSKDGKSEYLLEQDITSGDTIIKKVNKEGDEMITDVEIMEFKKGEVVMGKDGKPVRVPDEYEEVTEANARIEGDVFNDPYYSDGIKVDEIIKEVDDKVPSIKYASGGLAYMLGE